MAVLSFVEKLSNDNDCIMLYRGISASGKTFFAYLRCNREGVEKLRTDEQHQAVPRDISDYGDVIYMNFLADPDAGAEAFLAQYLYASEKLKEDA